MKICWDNLEGFYLTKSGTLYRPKKFGYKRVVYFKICKVCNREFLGNVNNICCSQRCNGINKSGDNHWTRYKKFSKETIKKMSKAKKGKYVGKNNPFYKKTHSEESKTKMRGKKPSSTGENHWLYKNMTHTEREIWLNKYIRGINSPSYGKHPTKETRKKMSEAKVDKYIGECNPMFGRCGELSPNWKGGSSFKEYCGAFYDREYKQDIRDRDHNMCWACGKFKKQVKQNLVVHHIDHNKQNCHPSNLITLCHSCHGIVQADVEWYTEWYQRIMSKRFRDTYI